jgi:hypothetical protein
VLICCTVFFTIFLSKKYLGQGEKEFKYSYL